MRGADESRSPMVRWLDAMRSTALVLPLFLLGVLVVLGATAPPAQAAASVTLSSGFNETRTTIPVTVDGVRTSCVLDTGSSVMLVSPALAHQAGLQGQGGTFEIAPDGRTYVDRQTVVGRFSIAGNVMRNVPALISSNISGSSALCGYDFFARFPTLIDRYHRSVTLFPPASKLAHLHCLPVTLGPRVPLATVEINGTWLDDIVLDSGMAGRRRTLGRRALAAAAAADHERRLRDESVRGSQRLRVRRFRMDPLRVGCARDVDADLHRTSASRRLQRDYRNEPFERARDGRRLPEQAHLLRRRAVLAGLDGGTAGAGANASRAGTEQRRGVVAL